MNRFELKERINNLSIWKKGDQRAPHKPLLILFSLGQLLAYQEIAPIILKSHFPTIHQDILEG